MSMFLLIVAAMGLSDPETPVLRSTTVPGWAPEIYSSALLARQDPDDDDVLGHGGLYLQIGAGLTTTSSSDGPDEEIDFNEGFAVPIAFGNRFGVDDGNAFAFDLELEGIYTDQDTDEGVLQAVNDVTVIGALVNGVGEFAFSPTFGFYFGAGIGMAALDIGTESDSVNDFDEEDGPFLAWQGKAGLRLWSSEDLAWSLGYRFLNIDDAEIDDDVGGASFELQTEQHILELGLRFQL